MNFSKIGLHIHSTSSQKCHPWKLLESFLAQIFRTPKIYIYIYIYMPNWRDSWTLLSRCKQMKRWGVVGRRYIKMLQWFLFYTSSLSGFKRVHIEEPNLGVLVGVGVNRSVVEEETGGETAAVNLHQHFIWRRRRKRRRRRKNTTLILNWINRTPFTFLFNLLLIKPIHWLYLVMFSGWFYWVISDQTFFLYFLSVS